MDFIAEADKLKQVLRQSWLVDGSRQETDAEHSWHIALIALLFKEYSNLEDLDLFKVIKMLLIHDIVEIDAGDTFIYDEEQNADKTERELKAAHRLFGLLPQDQRHEYLQLWEEFETQASPEAQFARAVDSMQPLILAYLNGGCSWKTHGIRRHQVVNSKQHMEEGSAILWEQTQRLLRKAVKKGFLQD
ncbi:MAG: HD family hydrolase [Promethearchaeota archaeon]